MVSPQSLFAYEGELINRQFKSVRVWWEGSKQFLAGKIVNILLKITGFL